MTASATTTAYRALVLDDRVHASLYVDERVYADEMDRIFTRGWVFVGHKSEVPGPDQRPSFTRELAWLRATRDRVSGYCDALVAARGAALAERSLWDGPPYAMIFPNLFLGEMNIAIVEPLAAAETVHRHNRRPARRRRRGVQPTAPAQSEAALGPSSFIVPDDAVTAERMQAGFAGSREGAAQNGRGWIDLTPQPRPRAAHGRRAPRRPNQRRDDESGVLAPLPRRHVGRAVNDALLREVEAFVFREARLADKS